MRIFITGANGSLGAELIARLNEWKEKAGQNIEIVVLAKDKNDDGNLIKYRTLKIIYGDISRMDDGFLEEHLRKVDVFIHLAALVHQPGAPRDLFFQVNYEATKRLCDAFERYSVSKLKQFIFISTVAVYGNYQLQPYDEGDVCLPDTPYAESKLMAEKYLSAKPTDSSLKYTILRPTTIYGGPHDKGNIASLIRLLKKWHVFPLFDSGKAKKSFVHVGDVAAAIISCINNELAFGQIFNISAPSLEMKEIIKGISHQKNIKVMTLPAPLLALKILSPKSKLTRNNSYSYEKAGKALNYKPRTFPAGL